MCHRKRARVTAAAAAARTRRAARHLLLKLKWRGAAAARQLCALTAAGHMEPIVSPLHLLTHTSSLESLVRACRRAELPNR